MEVSGELELARCAKKNMADNDGAGGPTARPERGRLRIYLGSAAGVGKTYAMLSEGHRRAERGADVVVGFAEAHGRPQTSALLDGLEVVPRRHAGVPRGHVRGDGPGRGARPAPRDRPGGRVRAHQRARFAQREALAGRGGTARRRDRRDLRGQHPAPGIPQRRGREDHRGTAAGDRARRHRPRRRPGRDGRHDARGAAPPDGARQHLPAGEDRRGADQLLPLREPRRAARARAALAGRQGGRGPAAVPRRAQDPGRLGGQGARGRRADRRARGQDADQAGGQDRRPVRGRRPAGRARHQVRRPDRRRSGRAGRPAAAGRVGGRHLPPGRRRRHLRGPADLRPGGERHPAGAGGQPPVVADRHAHRPRHRRPDHPRLRRHRRAHRDPRADGPRPGPAAAARRDHAAPEDRRVRAGRRAVAAADRAAGAPARRRQPDQRRADVPDRGDPGRPGRRVRARRAHRHRGLAAAELLLHPAHPPVDDRGGEQLRSRSACSSPSRSWSARWSTSRPGGPRRRRGPTRSPSCSPPRPAACSAASRG